MAGAAFATMYDHYFTGDALADFGLRPDDLVMSGIREDLDDASSTRSSSTQSTVVVSNLHPSPGPCSSKGKSSNLSVADGTILSSLDDDDSAVTATLRGMLLPRIILCVSISLICMSVLGGVMVWRMFLSTGSGNSMGYSSYDGIEPLNSSLPSPFTPSGGGGRTKGDLFSDTDTGRPDCPGPFQPNPPLPGKKGVILGLGNSDIQILQKISSLKPQWTYSMSQQRPESQAPLIEYVPMVPFATNELSVVQLDSEQHRRVMGFYEPDASGRTALSVDEAVDQWRILEDFNLPLISPSTVDPTGTWMKDFMELAHEMCLRIEWVGIHWFGEPSFPEFKTSLHQIYNMYGRRPVLLTEFAIADWATEQRGFNRFTQEDVLEFMKQALPWLEEQEWIAGYAWYEFDADHPAGGPSALFDESGLLTGVGSYYSSVTRENPVGNQ